MGRGRIPSAATRVAGSVWIAGIVALGFAPSELGASCTAGAKRLLVPEDCTTIGSAVTALTDGGTIDLAPGTYTFASGGLNLSGKNKAMTLTARVPRSVTFSGQGLYPVVKIVNTASNGEPIVFEGIRFVDGYSSAGFQAGGVSLKNAEVTFVDCDFEDLRNDHAGTGGGALGLYGGSRALIVGSSFADNRAKNQGGAIYVYTSPTDGESSAWIHDSVFERNSTAFAGFTNTAAGGAIYARNARVLVSDSRFTDNASGWVAGAIYGWGDFNAGAPYCDHDEPAGDLVVVRSRFEGNRSDDSAGEGSVPQTFGGALHAENCARIRVHASSFEDNSADWGGAISVDHARLEIDASSFRANYNSAPAPGEGYPIGGAIYAGAIDPGAANHPNGSVTIRSTLVEGGRLGDPDAPTSQVGGCLKTIGDGSESLPVPASARLAIEVSDSAFFGCSVDQLVGMPFVGGGAIDLDRSALTLARVLFARSSATAPGGVVGNGSGIASREDSRVAFGADVVFSGGATDGPSGDLYQNNGSSSTGSFDSFTATQSSPAGGMLVAAPPRAALSGEVSVEAALTWGWAGASATLDGDPVGTNPRNGTRAEVEGEHELVVAGLGGCTRCAATIAPPAEPLTTLSATPQSISSGASSTLAWTTPEGTLVGALVDRGVGETGAAGNAGVSPGGSSTYRRLAITEEGGTFAEARVYVDEAPPAPLFASGFESGFAGWIVVP